MTNSHVHRPEQVDSTQAVASQAHQPLTDQRKVDDTRVSANAAAIGRPVPVC